GGEVETGKYLFGGRDNLHLTLSTGLSNPETLLPTFSKGIHDLFAVGRDSSIEDLSNSRQPGHFHRLERCGRINATSELVDESTPAERDDKKHDKDRRASCFRSALIPSLSDVQHGGLQR